MRRSKFGAVATVLDGIRFHSKGEAQRWAELKVLEKAHVISSLNRQPKFGLHVQSDDPIGFYIADFAYYENGLLTVEDFKGIITPLARWKIKHFEDEYRVKVRITGAASRKRAA